MRCRYFSSCSFLYLLVVLFNIVRGVSWLEIRKKALIASFGFDIDFVLRRLASREYSKVVLLALYTSEEAFKRVEKAYHTLSVVCKSLQDVECHLEKIEPEKSLRSLLSIIKYNAEKHEKVELYLTGGTRILVAMTLASAILLPKYLASKIEIIVEGEGFECETKINLSKYQELVKLDERDKKIIFELHARGPLKLSQLEEYTEIPRTTLYRRLEELVEKKLVKKEEDKYIIDNAINTICKT